MLKRLIALLVALTLSICMLPVATFAQEESLPDADNAPDPVKKTVSVLIAPDIGLPENLELFTLFAERELYGYDAVMFGSAARANLNSLEQAIYDVLKANIESVADNGGSTIFPVSEVSGLKTVWTNTELGVTSVDDPTLVETAFFSQFDLNRLVAALLSDCPFDLYWYDKTTGVFIDFQISVSGYNDGTQNIWDSATVSDLSFSFAVASDFESGSNTVTADVGKIALVKDNAAQVVADNAAKSDYEKLLAYKDYICDAVDYNYAAAGDASTPYGAPWQLIYVLDGDNGTKAVCEGYAKAFMYLCDTTTFSDDVSCYTVEGYMDGGAHMWNIVTLDGSNYLVDVTNSESGTVGQDGSLFLAGGTGSAVDGYAVAGESYVYSSHTRSLWGTGADSILTLEATGYVPEGENEDIIASGSLDGGLFTWTLDAQGTLIMSGRYIRTNIFDPSVHPWHSYRKQVKKVVFADTFNFIPEYACTGMINLKEVQLGSGAKYIGKHAFTGCTALTSVSIPSNVKEIRDYAFDGCESLETLIFEDGSALETIGVAAFRENSIKTLTIPASVKTIGKEAFYGNAELTTLVLQEGLEELGSCAFAYCGKLTGHLYLPSTLTMATDVFLESMGFETVEAHCKTFGQVSAGSETVKKVVLGENTSSIGNNAFTNFTALETVELKGILTGIGRDAFSGCENLTDINLPEGLETIDKGAFQSCKKLKEVQLPEGLETIGSEAFRYSGLTSVKTPDSVTEIGSWAFDGCSDLEYAEIGAGVEVLESQFNDCPKLEMADIRHIETIFNSFQNCASLTGICWGENLERIQQDSFRNCDSLERCAFPASIEELGQRSFADCDNLKEIEFCADAPQWINSSTFENVEAVVYYPADASWPEEAREKFGGTLTWKPVCETHTYSDDVMAGGCSKPRICVVCGEASGDVYGHIYDNNVDGTCNICSAKRQDMEYREVVHMFRMYNPNSGEHFYTGSTEERDNLIEAGWHYEGVGFTFPANTGAPVYRLYHEPTGEHLYTMNVEEKDKLIAEGWNYEGIAFNSAYDTEAVQHRLHNPNATVGAYHFTFSLEERDMLIAAGWEYQGIGWYSCWK